MGVRHRREVETKPPREKRRGGAKLAAAPRPGGRCLLTVLTRRWTFVLHFADIH